MSKSGFPFHINNMLRLLGKYSVVKDYETSCGKLQKSVADNIFW